MVDEFSWKEPLGDSGEDVLFVRFVLDIESNTVLGFAVIYGIISGKAVVEVIRYDCSVKERLNVHKFYRSKNGKIYLDREPALN